MLDLPNIRFHTQLNAQIHEQSQNNPPIINAYCASALFIGGFINLFVIHYLRRAAMAYTFRTIPLLHNPILQQEHLLIQPFMRE